MPEKYVTILKENSIKITPQRIEILRYLDRHMTHPTVEEIYSTLKKKNPSLSKTTVYNSLQVLKEHKIIQTLSISTHESRYDLRDDLHHHFLCKNCGKIIDIDIECPNVERIAKEGHRVDEVHGYFKGICKYCLEKEKNNGK